MTQTLNNANNTPQLESPPNILSDGRQPLLNVIDMQEESQEQQKNQEADEIVAIVLGSMIQELTQDIATIVPR